MQQKLKLTEDELYYAEVVSRKMKPGTVVTIAYDFDYSIRIYKNKGY